MMAFDPAQSVTVNNWLFFGLLSTLRYFLVGVSWGWLMPGNLPDDRPGWQRYLMGVTRASVVGVTASLLAALFLAEAGLYRQTIEWCLLISIAAVGFITGLVLDRERFTRYLAQCLPGLLIFSLAMVGVMTYPRGGEWVLGGWDPGIYINQGMHVERTGTFSPGPDSLYQRLTDKELMLFTQGRENFRESFSGVPINRETRSFQHFFFRLMPTLVAQTARSGGLRAASRVNMVAGLLSILAFMSLSLAGTGRVSAALLTSLVLLTQPIWLYHLHTPTSEMLQLFLICGIGFSMLVRNRNPFASIMLPVLIFAALLNRFSFFPFACLLLLVLSWIDIERHDRRRILLERAGQITAIAAGVIYDMTFTSITILRIENIISKLFTISCGLIAMAVLLDVAASMGRIRKRLFDVPRGASWAAWVAMMGLLAGTWLFGTVPWVSEASYNLHRIVPYLGKTVVLLAAAGACVLFCMKNSESRTMKGFVLFLCGISFILVVERYVRNLYPWSTRRDLAYTVPLVSLLSGYFLASLWDKRGKLRMLSRGICVALTFLMLALAARQSWHAWSHTEYDGISQTLSQLALHIDDEDVVVADHQWWGTPLTFIYGKQVLNGRHLYLTREKEKIETAHSLLSRLKSEGVRIRFLTSTERGLSIYPFLDVDVALDWSSGPVVLSEIAHHKRGRRFPLRSRKFTFQLYSLQ